MTDPTDSADPTDIEPTDIAQALAGGELTVEAVIATGNNAVFRASVEFEGKRLNCVYKPVRGERPLWDFPDTTLAPREVAAHLIDQALGWGFVPPTVLRDGPLGPGACQQWINGVPDAGLFAVVPRPELPAGWLSVASGLARDERGEVEVVVAHADDERLARLAVFDAVINNSDRKAGHLLVTPEQQLYGIDHGVAFHTDPKLRTVLWGWAGKPIPADSLAALHGLATAMAGPLAARLAACLSPAEVRATAARLRDLLERLTFPEPAADWPPLPYPLV